MRDQVAGNHACLWYVILPSCAARSGRQHHARSFPGAHYVRLADASLEESRSWEEDLLEAAGGDFLFMRVRPIYLDPLM